MDWQCDVQVAHGSLRKAFSRFGLFQEGEAATRLLAHVSDLKHGEEKQGSDICCFLLSEAAFGNDYDIWGKSSKKKYIYIFVHSNCQN